jgi:single-stranded DNA-binding protein
MARTGLQATCCARFVIPVEGNLAADLELRYAPSGKQVVEFTELVHEHRLNGDTAEWEDGEPTRHGVAVLRAFLSPAR